MKTTRRDFLRAGVTIAGVASGVSAANEVVFSSDAAAGQSSERMGDILYPTLGRAGERVSALGVGGHHLGDLPTVDEAIDAGITFFENCWRAKQGRCRLARIGAIPAFVLSRQDRRRGSPVSLSIKML